jgi:hypothetical protein
VRAAIGYQQNDSTAGVSAIIEDFDGGAQRAPDLRIGETSARATRGDSCLHHRCVLRERHHAQRTITEVHEREAVIRALSDEFRKQLPRHFRFLPTLVIKQLGGVDGSPITRQHVIVHAATSIQQNQDLRAFSHALHVSFRATRLCEREHHARQCNDRNCRPQRAHQPPEVIGRQPGEPGEAD